MSGGEQLQPYMGRLSVELENSKQTRDPRNAHNHKHNDRK